MYRVIELGHIVAGPTAGLILSQMNFEVIKVEKPGSGDIARKLTGESAGSFAYFNRNKKSVEINTKLPVGKEALVRLIKSADIIIDNFSADYMVKLGLPYEELKKINPKIIYVTIRGYSSPSGQGRRSLDYPIEIDSGIAYMNGLSGRPMRVGASLVDMFSASMAVIGIYDALLKREKTGEGGIIDCSLFGSAMFMIGQHISTYQINEKELLPINEAGFAWGIYDFFKSEDGKNVFIAVTTDDQWKKFCRAFNFDEEIWGKYSSNEIRFKNRHVLLPIISVEVEKYSFDVLKQILEKNQIVYSLLRRPWELLQDSESRNEMNDVNYGGKKMKLPKAPMSQKREEEVPKIGDSNKEILTSLNFEESEIARITSPE